ncbi:MAG: ABC transporter permease [Thermoanaerobaculia bacterium]|nr:ABC transporter permease [Thermoanaerobaculia bacterium]
MLRNYLTVAFRNLRRHGSYTAVNVAGLTLGITCGLLIFLLARFHLSTDTYHAKADRIYRIVTDLHFGNRIQTPGVPYPFAKAFRSDFPEVEVVAQTRFLYNSLVSVGSKGTEQRKKFMLEQEMGFFEPEFFDVFDYQWLKGDKNVLREPFTAAITTSMAAKLFGDQNPVGQTIRVDNKQEYKVAGLLADIAPNTEFKREIFLSYASYQSITPKEDLEHWGGVSSNQQCFVVLPPAVKAADIEQNMKPFIKKFHEDHDKWEHHLQPLSDMYFNPDYGGDVPKALLWALVVVGLLLVGTAGINFINLATAQALNRSREVGVRKVVGSSRMQLFTQFLLETGIITLFAVLSSLALAYWLLPAVNDLTHSKIAIEWSNDFTLWAFLLAMLLGVTLFSGAYPALVLAGFKPVQALKGKITTQTLGGYSVRRGLVVAQFVICQILVIAALVITGQMRLLKNASMGFQKEAIVMLPLPQTDKSKAQTLRQQLMQVSGVKNVSFAFDSPAGNTNNTTNCRFDTRQEDELWQIDTRPADEHFLETFGLQLVAGRNLQPSDTVREYLINETALKKLGLSAPDEAIGKSFRVWGIKAPIVGVVRDFHTRSLREEIGPVVLMSSLDNYMACGVKIDLSQTTRTLAVLEKTWNQIFPDEYYSYEFLDDRIARFYEMESALLGMVQGFCGIAIFIGCLGLYGLISFTAARKKKEIGVRKVLGASTGQILGLFGKEFIRLILLAFLLAAPVGWWAMNNWLEDYPYRIALNAGIFLLAIGLTLLVAALTVSAQSVKAALAQPADSLRTE